LIEVKSFSGPFLLWRWCRATKRAMA